VVQDMHSGVLMQDCLKLTRVLSTVVGWCRIRIAVLLCKTVQSLPVCFRQWLGGVGYA